MPSTTSECGACVKQAFNFFFSCATACAYNWWRGFRLLRTRAGDAGSIGKVREQDPDANQDRPELQDAVEVPSRGFLYAQGVHVHHGRSWQGDREGAMMASCVSVCVVCTRARMACISSLSYHKDESFWQSLSTKHRTKSLAHQTGNYPPVTCFRFKTVWNYLG